MTPSLTFGINFLPSFHFESPMNMINTLSPQLIRPLDRLERHERLSCLEVPHKGDIFNILTPPSSSKSLHNKLLEAPGASEDHSRSQEKQSGGERRISEQSMDIWSLQNDAESANTSSISNMAEHRNDKKSSCLTPRKLIIGTGDRNKGHPPIDRSLHMRSDLKRDSEYPSSLIKKRKLIPEETSPSASIATKIELMVSPRTASSVTHEEDLVPKEPISTNKVWNPELDKALSVSYLKFKTYKASGFFDPEELKSSSQNKILSQMLLKKTGVLRSTKQIASRLFRLSKKPGSIVNEAPSSSPLDERLKTPRETPIDEYQTLEPLTRNAAIADNTDCDGELDSLPSLSTSQSEARSGSGSTMKGNYALFPRDIKLKFEQKKPHTLCHEFLSHARNESMPLSPHLFKEKIGEALKKELETELVSLLEKQGLPVLFITNNLNLNTSGAQSISPGSEMSPFEYAPSPVCMDFDLGRISSYMIVDVKANCETGDFLQWKCITKVFKANKMIFKRTDSINGYMKDEQKHLYELQIPFLKEFWSGYLSFLKDGINDEEDLRDLYVVQYICDRNYTERGGNINGVFMHSFHSSSFELSTSKIEYVSFCNDYKIDESDENATVLAVSSPFDGSFAYNSPLRRRNSQQLFIDTTKAKDIISHGPHTAPIYNSDVLREGNMLSIQGNQSTNSQMPNSSTMGRRFISEPEISLHQFSTGRSKLLPKTDLPHGRVGELSNEQSSSFVKTEYTNPEIIGLTFDVQKQYSNAINPSESFVAGKILMIPPIAKQEQRTAGVVMMSTPQRNHNLAPRIHADPAITQMVDDYQMQSHPLLFTSRMGTNFQDTQVPSDGHVLLPIENQVHLHSRQPVHFPVGYQPSQHQSIASPYHRNFNNRQDDVFVKRVPILPAGDCLEPFRQGMKNKPSKLNKENYGPKQITFCPIMEYDPSKDINSIPKPPQIKHGIGVHRFPVNTPVSIYKPKKT